jgi:NAD(P)-dependent dehydrogenase (short-subunit alcohol dehydrogenase family)
MTTPSQDTNRRRVAVVTGAAAGIGQAYALRLAQDGRDVVIADLGPADETEQMVRTAGATALAVRTDVSDPDSVAGLAASVTEQFGGADILVHNAGIYPLAPFEETTFETWRKVMSVNLDSAFHLTQAFLSAMRERGWGRVVLIASTSFHTGPPGLTAYAASKGGVIGLMRSLATEAGPDGVTVKRRSGSPSGLASAALSAPQRVRFQPARLGGPVFHRRQGPGSGGAFSTGADGCVSTGLDRARSRAG